MDEEKTIKLRKPITLGSGETPVTYPELELREPTAGELEKASRADTNFGVMINLISIIAKIPRAAAEKLSQRDFTEASEYLAGFTNAGTAAAGATSSPS